MTFTFSRRGATGWDAILQRVFEILPGATSWTLLVGLVLLTWLRPLLGAVLIIAFELYWLMKLFYMTLFLSLSYWWLSLEKDVDWMARVHAVNAMDAAQVGQPLSPRGGIRRRLSERFHRRQLAALRESGITVPRWQGVYHVVIIPIVNEPRAVFEAGVQSLAQQTFPTRQILVILAVEERAKAEIHAAAWEVQARYRHLFYDFRVVAHPDHLPGEARVKGANATYAAKEAAAYLTAEGIPFERVVVSCFDADTVVSRQYIACVTYHFLVTPQRTRASFQPIPVYHNNIWEAPAFSRVLEMGSSFFQLIEATNPEKLVTFSSHSMSFKALVDVGYWPVDMISDDSAIFWKAFLHFDGEYRVVPMCITLSMDMVSGASWWKAVVHVYRQKRRWAWGVENFPLVMRAFLRKSRIPVYERVRQAFKLYEGHISWATGAFLLTCIGWLPAVMAGREFSDSVIYYSGPRITQIIFHLASISLVTSLVLGLRLLPKGRVRHPVLRRIQFGMEWLFVPVIVTFLSAMPALDAQTRLMVGRYMEFWVTRKTRSRSRETLRMEPIS